MLPLSGLLPLGGGTALLLLVLLTPDRWKRRTGRESTSAFCALFGVAPIAFGLVELFTDGVSAPVYAAMGAALLAAAGLAVRAVRRRDRGDGVDAVIITALALPFGLTFGSVFTAIDRPGPAPVRAVQADYVPCTVKVTSVRETGAKVEGRKVFKVGVRVKAGNRPELSHRLVEELYRYQYLPLLTERAKPRYACRASGDLKYVEVFWGKPVRAAPSPGRSGTAR